MGTSSSRGTSGFNYINGLPKNLSSSTNPFADDTSIFSTAENVNVSTDQLNSDLEKISNLAH